jgi:hypothetical protein
VKIFGVEIEKTDDAGRLLRPTAVAVFGCLLSTAGIAILTVVAGIEFKGETSLFLIGFLVFACAASCAYAFVGWRFGRPVALRVLGVVGGIAALGGLAYLIWLLLARGT